MSGAELGAVPYNAAVERYFRQSAPFPPADLPGYLFGEAGSEPQGAQIQVAAGLKDGLLTSVGFRVYACPHIIAACHRAAELLDGAPAERLGDLDMDGLRHELDIPVEKAGKLLILKDALLNAYHSAKRQD